MSVCIVLFHNNLRLNDNAALAAAVATGNAVLPVFVLDENLGRALGGAARWWLHRSLAQLDESVRRIGSQIVFRRGDTLENLAALVEETGASQIFLQHGYDPEVQRFEEGLNLWASEHGAQVHRFGGQVLFPPEGVSTKQGKPYTVFSPYWRECLKQTTPGPPLKAPTALRKPNRIPGSVSLEELGLHPSDPDWSHGLSDCFVPGEKSAFDGLQKFTAEGLLGYKDQRDLPAVAQATSRLSPHLRFGEISPRMVWNHARHVMDKNSDLQIDGDHFLRELGWRDFSYHLLHHFPSLPHEPLKATFADFPWRENDYVSLAAWQKGLTGFPIVDAGMRQLWQTGWMHNRVRMVVASFLVKELLIDWREGEAWFWDTLVDADPASNTASWQWVAGCGADAAPYFRIFNPILQGEKFDPEGDYVRTHVPELRNMPSKYVHHPWDAPDDVLTQAGVRLGDTYPMPIVDRKFARARALDAFAQIKVSK